MPVIHLGYEVGGGAPVEIPLRHMVVTGQTQEAGKTTTLEAMIARSGVKAVAFVTKRGEGSFAEARVIAPYFREQADWQFVASILEASRGEKLKFERAWIIRASKGAKSLADVQRNVRKAMETAKGMSADVYLTLDAYLEAVVPQIDAVEWAKRVTLAPGINVMDLTALNVEMQHLVIRSTIDWVLQHETDTVVVVPEAWKFIPQGRGTPVKLAAESYIRQAAGLRNYLWLDSQDIAGVEKIILKSVPIWLLGVQRESNEIKRTLAQIPGGIKKPKPEAIATLGLGEFFACWGTTVTKVYVQPAWMPATEAEKYARGELRQMPVAPAPALPSTTVEDTVNEAEAQKLREENARLRRRVEELETPSKPPKKPADSVVPVGVIDEDAMYERLLARLLKAPPLVKLSTSKPEIEVQRQRQVIEVSHSTLKGRLAGMIAEGFFDSPVTGSAAYSELRDRRGFSTSKPNVYRDLDGFAEMGFVTKEEDGYRAVSGMKINVVEK
jgi:BMFP domain-containing protein YqiC